MNSTLSFKKCNGYDTGLGISIFLFFPFQMLDEVDVAFENDTFHSLRCLNNKYICSNQDGINDDCRYLFDRNQKFRSLFKHYDMPPNIFTNHKYYNFNQIKFRLDSLIDEKNHLKLGNLNLIRQHLSNRNRVTLYKRLTTLLSLGEIHNANS